MSEYTPIPYPSFRYHAHKPPVIVASIEEDEALGAGWHKSPADCRADVVTVEQMVGEPPEPTPVTVDEIISEPEAPVKRGPGRPRKVV